MKSVRISEKVIETVRKESKGDEAIAGLLIGLLYEEASRLEGWWYTDYYKKKIQERADQWEDE